MSSIHPMFLRRLPPLFWIGLLPVIILLGVWGDTRYSLSKWDYSRDIRSTLRITLWSSWLQVTTIRQLALPGHAPEELTKIQYMKDTGPRGKWQRSPQAKTSQIPWIMPYQREEQRVPIGGGHVTEIITRRIPFWIFLLAYLPFWFALSAWQAWLRHRRQRAEAERVKKMAEEYVGY